jgi:hypothetical protein
MSVGPMTTDSFGPTSRYRGLGTNRLTTASGRVIVYVRRRFVPPPDRFQLLTEHTVVQGQRPDQIAAQYLGDPEQSWRLCDANGVVDPSELTATPGRRVRITLPEGVSIAGTL